MSALSLIFSNFFLKPIAFRTGSKIAALSGEFMTRELTKRSDIGGRKRMATAKSVVRMRGKTKARRKRKIVFFLRGLRLLGAGPEREGEGEGEGIEGIEGIEGTEGLEWGRQYVTSLERPTDRSISGCQERKSRVAAESKEEGRRKKDEGRRGA